MIVLVVKVTVGVVGVRVAVVVADVFCCCFFVLVVHVKIAVCCL